MVIANVKVKEVNSWIAIEKKSGRVVRNQEGKIIVKWINKQSSVKMRIWGKLKKNKMATTQDFCLQSPMNREA